MQPRIIVAHFGSTSVKTSSHFRLLWLRDLNLKTLAHIEFQLCAVDHKGED
jgi:hypothetical protein